MTYEFARWLVNLLASEVVQPLAGQVINFACPDVSDVMSFAVEYFPVHLKLYLKSKPRGVTNIGTA